MACEEVYSCADEELAAILRVLLFRNGGKIRISEDELPTKIYTIDVDHTEDGFVSVYLHEQEGRMQ